MTRTDKQKKFRIGLVLLLWFPMSLLIASLTPTQYFAKVVMEVQDPQAPAHNLPFHRVIERVHDLSTVDFAAVQPVVYLCFATLIAFGVGVVFVSSL